VFLFSFIDVILKSHQFYASYITLQMSAMKYLILLTAIVTIHLYYIETVYSGLSNSNLKFHW